MMSMSYIELYHIVDELTRKDRRDRLFLRHGLILRQKESNLSDRVNSTVNFLNLNEFDLIFWETGKQFMSKLSAKYLWQMIGLKNSMWSYVNPSEEQENGLKEFPKINGKDRRKH